jgi:hypothetical protein
MYKPACREHLSSKCGLTIIQPIIRLQVVDLDSGARLHLVHSSSLPSTVLSGKGTEVGVGGGSGLDRNSGA